MNAGMATITLVVATLLFVALHAADLNTRPPPQAPILRYRNTVKPEPSIKKDGKPKHCGDIWNSGIREPGQFTIYPNSTYSVKVWCEHSLQDTATVFLRRQFGNESFIRSWNDYKLGFGHPQRDYWMGLDALYHLTYTGNMKLSIALQDWTGRTEYVVYNVFHVADESQRYRLTIGSPSPYNRLADDMSFSNAMYFSTYDRPDTHNCVRNQHAGWWYNYCAYALLTGQYYYGGRYPPHAGFYDGIYWKDWMNYDYSLKYVSMAVLIR